MLKEFREFALRGNALDLAIGLIIGAAFGAIVSSLVDDVIMPPIGLLLGNVDFANLFLTLKDGPQAPGPYASLEAARTAGAVTWNIGLFINSVIKFVIVAFAVFLIVKMFNRMREQFDKSKEILLRKEKEELASTAEPAPLPAAVAAAPAASPRQEILLEEIRDLLRTQQTKPAARSRSTPSGSQTK